MRKIVLFLWAVDTVALVWLFGDTVVHGIFAENSMRLEIMGGICAGLGLILLFWKVRKDKVT